MARDGLVHWTGNGKHTNKKRSSKPVKISGKYRKMVTDFMAELTPEPEGDSTTIMQLERLLLDPWFQSTNVERHNHTKNVIRRMPQNQQRELFRS